MSGKELEYLLDSIGKNGRLQNKIIEDKAEYSPGTNKVGVFYRTAAHLSPREYLELKKELEGYSTAQVEVRLSQAGFAEELQKDRALLEKRLKDFCVLKQPAIAPFLESGEVRLDDARLELAFADEMAAELFQAMGLKDALQDYMDEAYGLALGVRLTVDEGANGSYEVSGEVEGAIARRAEARKPAVPAPAEPQAEPAEKPAPRRRGKDDMPVTAVEHLEVDTKCAIDGEVVFTESKVIREDELTKHQFIVCDYTGSVTCFFLESTRYPTKLELPKRGQWVRVFGEYKYDNFARENVVQARRIERSGHVRRKDEAQEKRVELHTHTQMSAQDGVSPAADIVARAAGWGMKAIAITDHGVVQAFPDAEKAARGTGVKVIYGVEGYMVDDGRGITENAGNAKFGDEFIVFDIETTGLSPATCDITEIGAVRVVDGEVRDTFQTFVKPSAPIPPAITSLTGITDDMVKDAPLPAVALAAFREFCGENDVVLAAHNADFDTKFIFGKGRETGVSFPQKVVDTVTLCRMAWPNLKNHKLNTVAKHLGLPLHHHRAMNDAECTARILLRAFGEFGKNGAEDFSGVDALGGRNFRHTPTNHVILLAKNKRGLRNLYKLVSDAHIDYFYRRPRMPKRLIQENREGLIVGSACEAGELYRAVLAGAPQGRLEKIASFYDYLEIQPVANNEFLVRNGSLAGMEDIEACNKKIVELGEKLGIPVVGTCDVHFLDPHGEYFRRIIQKVQGYDDAEQPPLYLRTTGEMLKEFAYLGEEKAYEVVVENTNRIADMTEEIQLFQDDTAMPQIEHAAERITELAYKTAKEVYGDPLPEIVEARLKRELDSIVGHGFSVLYYSAHKLVKKSNEDGYLVGSRGSVGSSLAATMTGITEVNPLPPHYVCPACTHSDFGVDAARYACGADLPDADCPHCGARMKKDGYDIPFEVFLGINADKVPDIDLNFSGEYQGTAHKYTEELFGKGHVFRAGTIAAVKDNIAFGYVSKFLEETGKTVSEAEKKRLIQGVSGVKKTTGQHPGGMVIVPHDREVYEFTPVQRPADKEDAEFITTHFDFNSMHDILIKLDILGHDVPTIIHILQELTGIDPMEIPLDDPKTMALFSSLEPLSVTPQKLLGIKMGTLGVPEFGTKFVRQMLADTMPTTMAELVRISGLSHGTDVWIGNAQELIKAGTCTLKEAICTRDDIMNYLVAKGVEKRAAFFIMEATRKGQVAKKGFSEEQQEALEAAQIPAWFTDSCRKIKYMFPKAHAVAYTIMSVRIAYMKVHHKEAFYASYFTVNAANFDGSMALEGIESIKKNWQAIEGKGNNATANEKGMAAMLEVACEMYLRGVHFLPVDLMKSDAEKYLIEETGIRMPFLAIPKLGATAAQALVDERGKEPFLSVEDLKKRARVSAAVIEEMQRMGTLNGLSQSNQISLFDL